MLKGISDFAIALWIDSPTPSRDEFVISGDLPAPAAPAAAIT
jgi:hypothetical protein